jgi:hypothetical protein
MGIANLRSVLSVEAMAPPSLPPSPRASSPGGTRLSNFPVGESSGINCRGANGAPRTWRSRSLEPRGARGTAETLGGRGGGGGGRSDQRAGSGPARIGGARPRRRVPTPEREGGEVTGTLRDPAVRRAAAAAGGEDGGVWGPLVRGGRTRRRRREKKVVGGAFVRAI